MSKPMTFHEWQTLAQTLHARADRLRDAALREARETCKAAGLDPGLLGIHPHNAMCSYEQGKPWPEVNYALCRRVIWLTNVKQWEASRIVERIIRRAEKRIVWGN